MSRGLALAVAVAWVALTGPVQAQVARPSPTVGDTRPVTRWLRGSTHVHAAPSGDSKTPVAEVVAWYEAHRFDFIVLTDHNRVTPPPKTRRLVVLAGSELTFNPPRCEPAPPLPDGACRIHVNALGVAGGPADKFRWLDRSTTSRDAAYRAAFAKTAELGGLPQLNHPQWHWGMSAELLRGLAVDQAVLLLEVANAQFAQWNAGAPGFPSVEALWDAALAAGATVWGVASDDAHHYPEGRYPPGGGWVVVDAERSAASIRQALAEGRFYASNGPVLSALQVTWDAIDLEVATRAVEIDLLVDGAVVATVAGPRARFARRPGGVVRVVVRAADGTRAWVQPVWGRLQR